MRLSCIYVNAIGQRKGQVCARWVKKADNPKHPLCFQHRRFANLYEDEEPEHVELKDYSELEPTEEKTD